jgi:hypothetical protein
MHVSEQSGVCATSSCHCVHAAVLPAAVAYSWSNPLQAGLVTYVIVALVGSHHVCRNHDESVFSQRAAVTTCYNSVVCSSPGQASEAGDWRAAVLLLGMAYGIWQSASGVWTPKWPAGPAKYYITLWLSAV